MYCKCSVVNCTPRKLSLVADLIRGDTIYDASKKLVFSRKKPSVFVKKALDSAIANAEHNFSEDIDSLYVAEIFVGKSFTLKRFRARAKGRGNRVVKVRSMLKLRLGKR